MIKKTTGRRGLYMGVNPYLYIAPALIALAVVVLLPLLYAFFLSLQKTQGLKGTFVGLANYAAILKEEYFWQSTGERPTLPWSRWGWNSFWACW